MRSPSPASKSRRGDDELVGARRADEAGEQIGGAHLATRHPDPDRLGREPGRLGGDAQVARVREREPAAVGGAVDRGDHWLREPAEGRDRVAEVRLPAHPGRGSFEAG